MEIIESSRTSHLVYETFLTGLEKNKSDLSLILEAQSEHEFYVHLYRYNPSGEYLIWCSKAQLSNDPLQPFWIIFPETEIDAATKCHREMIELFTRYFCSSTPGEFREHLEDIFDKLLKELQDN